MFRTIYWYVYFTVSLIMTAPAMYRYKKLKETMPPAEYAEKVHSFAARWSMRQIKNTGASVHVSGIENIPANETVLFVGNHLSNIDIALLLCYVATPKGFVAKTELLKVPILRTWMRYLNCVFMDRNDIRSAASAITDGINILKNGYSMVVFPEGTRSKTGEPGEFKGGSFKLATKAGVPIIPFTVRDTHKLMEANNNKIKPADVYLTIHPPIPVKGLSKEDQSKLPDKIRAIVTDSLY